MKKFLNIVEYLFLSNVHYYTVQFEDEEKSETEKFFDKYLKLPETKKSAQYLKVWLAKIGENHLATDEFFRKHDNYVYQPPPAATLIELGYEDDRDERKLRLYGIRITEEIVVLTSGAIKISDKLRGSPECHEWSQFASNISSQINRQRNKGILTVEGKNLVIHDNFKIEIKPR